MPSQGDSAAGTGLFQRLVWPNINIGTTIACFPMVVNTAVGLASAEPEMLDLVRSLKATRWQIYRRIRFPNAVPGLDCDTLLNTMPQILDLCITDRSRKNGLGWIEPAPMAKTLEITFANAKPGRPVSNPRAGPHCPGPGDWCKIPAFDFLRSRLREGPMAQLLGEITWRDPILKAVSDPAWEAEVRRRTGMVGEVDRRVAPSPWVREACVASVCLRPSVLPMRLLNIGALVSAQENSCRYCYGTNRAFMRILGYSEAFISRIEQDAQVAELDAKERAFIAFCRHLARSRPRPAKADREALVALGYSPLEVNEMALVIASCCFYNRMSTLVASPPEQALERMAGGMLGRLLNLVGPLIRNLIMRPRTPIRDPMDPAALSKGPFGPVVATLAGLPGATLFRAALDGAFASDVLPRSTKALMFAVVARALACRPSEDESRKLLLADGFDHAEIESALSTFASARLSPRDAKILKWVRETVAFRPEAIQDETRALAEEIGEAAILEAIGVAALANATVRLGMLLE